MKRIVLAAISSAFLLTTMAAVAGAEDVSTKKLSIKDNADPAKRSIQFQTMDEGVAYSEADSPGTKGASVHVYSATEDVCVVLPAGPEWTDSGKSWRYKNTTTMNQASIADGKLIVKYKGMTGFENLRNAQSPVSVQVQFGDTGVRYCARCSAPTKVTSSMFSATKCTAAPCDIEIHSCDPSPTTTITTTTTSTTLPPLPGTVLKAVLPKTSGLFSYAMTAGVPGAEIMCGATFAGSHVCRYTELQAAEAAHDLDNIKDINGVAVTAFWAIDPLQAVERQCMDAGAMPWHYATAHLSTGGDSVALNNATGALGALVPGGAGNRNCSSMKWVGCCQ